jgi:hypothetical protein
MDDDTIWYGRWILTFRRINCISAIKNDVVKRKVVNHQTKWYCNSQNQTAVEILNVTH